MAASLPATFCSQSPTHRGVLDGVCDVESELHVHGSLGHAGAPSVDDGDQGAVQFVHVTLGQQPAPTAGLVLHLREDREEDSWSWLRTVIPKGLLRRYHVSLR